MFDRDEDDPPQKPATFETLEEAIGHCKSIIYLSINDFDIPDRKLTLSRIMTSYCMSGEEPFICDTEAKGSEDPYCTKQFDVRGYAEECAREFAVEDEKE